ncbi:MAG TPA: DUF2892 domain-containing protein [bacterium]|nr:DUF2892 domain-containing protein [bacterium]
MKQNEGVADRIIRLLLAIILAGLGSWSLIGAWQMAAYVIAAILLITAVTGFCGLYKVLGISTIKQPKPDLGMGGSSKENADRQ